MTRQQNDVQDQCKICFDDYNVKEMRCAACNHRFCRACWKGYIGAKVAEGPAVLGLRCPLAQLPSSGVFLPNAPLLIFWRRLPDSEVCSMQLVLPEAACQGQGLRSGAANAAGASEHNLRSSERHRPEEVQQFCAQELCRGQSPAHLVPLARSADSLPIAMKHSHMVS